jgi:hypothetical protein
VQISSDGGDNESGTDHHLDASVAPDFGHPDDSSDVGAGGRQTLTTEELYELADHSEEMEFLVALLNGELRSLKITSFQPFDARTYFAISAGAKKTIVLGGKIPEFTVNLPEEDEEDAHAGDLG